MSFFTKNNELNMERVQFIGNKAIASNKMSIYKLKLFPIMVHGVATVHTTPRVDLPE